MSNFHEPAHSFTPTNELTGGTNRLARVLNDLHQRRVFRTAVTYTLASWLILQVADIAFPLLGAPASALKTLACAAVFGFPVAVIVAWIYQITPNGIVIHRSSRAPAPRTGRRTDFLVNSSLLAISSVLACLLLAGALLSGRAEAPRILIKVTDIPRHGAAEVLIASGLEQELRQQLVQTTELEPLSAAHASDVDRSASLVLWVGIYAEVDQVRVGAFLLDLEGGGSYPYIGAFDLPNGPAIEIQRKAAVRIAGEVRRALHGGAAGSGVAGRSAIPSEEAADRRAPGTLEDGGARGSGRTTRS